MDTPETQEALVRFRNEHWQSCNECSEFFRSLRDQPSINLIQRDIRYALNFSKPLKIRDGLCQTGKKHYDLVMRGDSE